MSVMKPFKKLLDFETAKKIILENTTEIGRTEKVDILQVEGRVLADSIIAPIDVPGFKRAAMDGYAVIAEETYNAARLKPKQFRLAGKIFPGKKPEIMMKKGTCIQIATGAPMPEGFDAVVMVEDTVMKGDNIEIFKPVYPGANVSMPDSDIKRGSTVLAPDTVLNAPKIGVLAALGISSVAVYSKPKMMLFPTGDELIQPGNKLEFGKIYDINSYTMASLLRRIGAEVEIASILEDTEEHLDSCIKNVINYDYVVFSGGSSVGERDLLAKVIDKHGKLLFHGIALKPGKPTICGVIGKTLVFGMPGYPTSCLTNTYVLLAPSIIKKARLPFEQKTVEVVLGENIVSTVGRYHIHTVRIENGFAYPAFKESGAITSMSEASGYIEIPANTEFVEKGTKVLVHLF